MPHTTVATGTFPSRKAANQAIERLVASGFARNSIEVHRHNGDEGYDVEVHTRKENLRRVNRLINPSSSMRVMSGAVDTAKSHPVMLLGAGILAGFVLYNLLPSGAVSSVWSRESGSRAGKRR